LLFLGQGEVLIRGLSRHVVGDTNTLMKMVKKGLDARSVGSTKVKLKKTKSIFWRIF